MNLLQVVVIFSVVLSGANWLLFVALVLETRWPWKKSVASSPGNDEAGAIKPRARPEKLVEAAGGLADAFGTAGPSASAAAMSLVCLLIAALAAGADKL